MNLLNPWKVDTHRPVPKRVIDAVEELNNLATNTTKAKYKIITYLGYQYTDGIYHAILTMQTMNFADKEYKGISILKFKDFKDKCILFGINQLLEENGQYGEYRIDPMVYNSEYNNIPDGSMNAFYSVTSGWVNMHVEPVALLATKIVNGINNIFIAEVYPIYEDAEPSLKMLTISVCGNKQTLDIDDIL